MKNFIAIFAILTIILAVSCKKDEDSVDCPCTESTWYQDLDEDGLGNPNESESSCDQPVGYVSNDSDDDDSVASANLHAAFDEFSENFNIYLDGDMVVMETNGHPNHVSPYWSNTTERTAIDPQGNELVTPASDVNHPLFVEPTVTSYLFMAPGNIDDFNGSYSLTIPVNPEIATSSTASGLGAIGFATSGAMIYNDEEGPGVPLDDAASSLDFTGAHTGPQSYHYHLEPHAWSDDDDALIGVMSDGFFLYGRKCYSMGSYPTDLDECSGHSSTTQHNGEEEYHYHIENELYLGQYFILFPYDFKGTPNDIQ